MNPSKIQEGSIEYSIGELYGKNVIFDFFRILKHLDVKGKLLFGEQFKIYDWDKDILMKLGTYFIRDLENCKKLGIDPDKGILLSGPVGCEKTSLMKLLKHLTLTNVSMK